MEQFHLFQDENSHHTFAGAPLQSTVSQRQASIDARGPLKAPVSARKALGNITNAGTIDGQATLKSQVGALGSRNGGRLGKNNGEVFVERPKTRQPLRSIQKQEKATSHVADNKHERLRDLMEGGVERPAGRLWEEEEMVLELQREEQLSKRMSGLVKGHRNAILHQIDLLMDSSDHVDMVCVKSGMCTQCW